MSHKRSKLKNQIEEKNSNLIILSLIIITIYFDPALADPFNVPKMLLLLFAGMLAMVAILFNYIKFKNQITFTRFGIISFVFGVALIFSAAISENKPISIFGENGRKNGLVTYLALIALMVATSIFFKIKAIERLLFLIVILSQFLSIYGFMQYFRIDPIKWDNYYNRIIITLGNPNFSASLLAILVVLITSLLFYTKIIYKIKIYLICLIIQLCLLIVFTESIQGILSVLIGVSFIVICNLYYYKKKIALIGLALTTIPALLILLAMFQIGPLTELIYKQSISLRGYYWRAGINMFTKNPISGVGLDNYGSYFKQYREVGYPLTVGYETGSNNAHNTFIQFFATGGILVGLSYLILMYFVIHTGLKSLLRLDPKIRILMSGLIGAWLSFQSQSLVSIDNIGISIWNYVISGCIIALAGSAAQINSVDKKILTSKTSFQLLQPFVSLLLIIPVLFFAVLIYRNERLVMQTYNLYANQAAQNIFLNSAKNTLDRPLLDNFYRMGVAARMSDYGLQEEAITELNKVINSNNHDLQALEILARINENKKNYEKVINIRKSIANFDPWNAFNYLQMGKAYKELGNYKDMNLTLIKIQSFDRNSEVSLIANRELVVASK